MSNHGTALSDDTIIRVDRSTPVVYPHYWWLKNVAHPEFQAKGPLEYDLATVELWLHKGQESARRVAGNLIKGQKKGRGVTSSLIYRAPQGSLKSGSFSKALLDPARQVEADSRKQD
jgi:hypothetical protein